jgi:hypothetical protein
MKKRFLSVLLAVCMVLTLLPALRFTAKASPVAITTYQQLMDYENGDGNYKDLVEAELKPVANFGWPTENTTLTFNKQIDVIGNWTIPSNMTITFNQNVTTYAESSGAAAPVITVQGSVTAAYQNHTAQANYIVANGGTLTVQKIAGSVTVQDGGTLTTPNTGYLEVFGGAVLTLNKTSVINGTNGIRLCGTLACNDTTLGFSVYPASAASDNKVDPIIKGTLSFNADYKGIQCSDATVTIAEGSTVTLNGKSFVGIYGGTYAKSGETPTAAKLNLNGTLKVQRTEQGGVGVNQYGSIVLGANGVLDMSSPSGITPGYESTTGNTSKATTCVTGTGTLKATNDPDSKVPVSIYGSQVVAQNCPYVASTVKVQVLTKHNTAPVIAPQTAYFVHTKTNQGSLNVAELLPSDKGDTTYEVTSTSYTALTNVAVSAEGLLTYGTTVQNAECTDTVTVKASMAAYPDATVTLTVNLTDKIPVTVSGVSIAGKDYDNTPIAAAGTPVVTTADGKNVTAECGTLVYNYKGVDDEIGTNSYNSATPPTNAGHYTLTVSVPANNDTYTGSETMRFQINRVKGVVTFSSKTIPYTPDGRNICDVLTFPTITLNGKDYSAYPEYSTGSFTKTIPDGNGGTIEIQYFDTMLGQATAPGKYPVTVSYDDGNVYSDPVTAEVIVTPAPLTVTGVTAADRAYNGKNTVTDFSGGTLQGVLSNAAGTGDTVSIDYSKAVGTVADANAGSSKAVTVTGIALTGKDAANYTLTQPAGVTVNITQAAAKTLADQNVTQKYTVTTQQSKSLAGLMPSDAGTLTYAKGSNAAITGVSGWNVASDGTVTYTLSGGAAGDTVTLPVTISSTNYEPSAVNVKITLTAKDGPELTIRDITRTYDGTAVADSAISGTAAFGGKTVEGTWAFKAGQTLTSAADSGGKTVVFTPRDGNTYAAAEKNITVTIAKAAPTGTPSYTAITEKDQTLADAKLAAGTLAPAGTIAWVSGAATKVTANTAYAWTYTPADTADYSTLTGSIVLWKAAAPAGGAASSAVTVPASSDAGSAEVSAEISGTTATLAPTDAQIAAVASASRQTGTVVIDLSALKADTAVLPEKLVAAAQKADNARGLAVVLPAGEVELDKTALTAAANKGDWKLSVQTVPEADLTQAQKAALGSQAGTALVVNVTLLANGVKLTDFAGGQLTIRVPYKLKAGEDASRLVVWFVKSDGTLEAHRAVYNAADGTVAFTTSHLSQYIVAEFPFADVPSDSYCYTAAAWAANSGVAEGKSAGLFAPSDTCTRAQAVTFLWRAMGSPEPAGTRNPFTDVSADAYYCKAVLWAAEKGVTRGATDTTFDPDGVVTRAQTVTFLWRAAGSPAAAAANPFGDVAPGAYCAGAVAWAVGSGITEGTSAAAFSPAAPCTRAQIVTFLWRFAG